MLATYRANRITSPLRASFSAQISRVLCADIAACRKYMMAGTQCSSPEGRQTPLVFTLNQMWCNSPPPVTPPVWQGKTLWQLRFSACRTATAHCIHANTCLIRGSARTLALHTHISVRVCACVHAQQLSRHSGCPQPDRQPHGGQDKRVLYDVCCAVSG
jgi:hypothetical protein